MKKNIAVENHTYPVDYPEECPLCHHYGDIQVVKTAWTEERKAIQVVYRCPFLPCSRHFIGTYGPVPQSSLISLLPSFPDLSPFPDSVTQLSPEFTRVFEEAEGARHYGLTQIAGPGFRKAFEFLIKDYAKSVASPERNVEIERTFSGKVVSDFIADPRIQAVATRALWLGNDETHYLRRWKDHDLEDLRILIRLTVDWIEIERLSAKYTKEMPE